MNHPSGRVKQGRGTRNPFNKATRTLVVEAMGDVWRLRTEKRNVGAWNQSTDYLAVDANGESVLLDRVMKGDSPDWAGMLKAVEGLHDA